MKIKKKELKALKQEVKINLPDFSRAVRKGTECRRFEELVNTYGYEIVYDLIIDACLKFLSKFKVETEDTDCNCPQCAGNS